MGMLHTSECKYFYDMSILFSIIHWYWWLLYRYDFVNIYDGEDEFAAQIASLTGILPNPVESSGNTIFINFLSDYDTGETGFRIGYEAGEFIRTNKYQTLYICMYVFNLSILIQM